MPPSCALLGGFAIGARYVLVLALCLVLRASKGNETPATIRDVSDMLLVTTSQTHDTM